jgi:hypothetical protein
MLHFHYKREVEETTETNAGRSAASSSEGVGAFQSTTLKQYAATVKF